MLGLRMTEPAITSIFIIFVLYCCGDVKSRESVEYELIQSLTSADHYDVNARPVNHGDDAVDVTIDIGFQQIISLDEPTQVLSTNVALRLYWKDVSLTWNPEEHGNVTSVRIYAIRIWRPDITLYNDVSTVRREAEKLYPVIVTYDGNVTYLSSALYVSSCQLDMTYFPWDSQECELELGSWTYDSSKLKLHLTGDSADTSVYIKNGEYVLDGVPAKLKSDFYPCCEHPYESISYNVQLTRKPMYYIVNLVIPCMFISFVGLFVFLLPPNSGEKISLALTVLLASTVFLMIVAESIPPQSSTVPLISKYFEAVILLLALTSIVTVFIINVHNRGSHYARPPHVIRVLVLDWLARLVFLRGTVWQKTANITFKSKASTDKENGGPVHTESAGLSPTVADIFNLDLEKNRAIKEQDTTNLLLFKILEQLRLRSTADALEGDTMEDANEWVYVAMVMDRLFLVMFFVISLMSTLIILLG